MEDSVGTNVAAVCSLQLGSGPREQLGVLRDLPCLKVGMGKKGYSVP